MTAEDFKHIAPTIPHQPGIYQYFNDEDVIIYVGKAKDLRKRVSSYFTKTFTSYKTHELVQRIKRIAFTIVNSEHDAFLLENSLIKEFKPRYNINLKDDKTYPYIVIKNEPFPRVFLTRYVVNDKSEYLGPFTSVQKVKELLEFIRQTVPLRNCTLNLTAGNIAKKKFKVCLEYHLGNCKGPCEGLQTLPDYLEGIQQVKNLLKGNLTPVIRHFKEEMKNAVADLAFEQAEVAKNKIAFLTNYQAKSVVAGNTAGDKDVFTLVKEKNVAYVNFLMVRNGTIVQTQTTKVLTHLDEDEPEILSFSIARLRQTFNSDATEIIVPFAIDYPEKDITITIPVSGDKKKLLELSLKNVDHYIEEIKNKERLKLSTNTNKIKVLEKLQEALQLNSLPVHIECFDNSNFQGSFPVSAMVCFKMGVPSKKDYRHFNVKTVEGINDFATMKEAVTRRYKRLQEEEQPFPQLVIIDGGKGQLSSAHEAMTELGLADRTTLVGLAKREEEVFFVGDKESVKLPYNSEELKLLRQIRDEVHRFGITFHRNKRSKGTFTNELESIAGIGPKIATQLLQHFKSVKNVKAQSKETLTKIVGLQKAVLVYKHFHPGDDT
ncbi:excinuclease ABC subunit UvrC [Terrimonas rubra]|uniref:UvrABC system protein C n=1 Tax=Terrimonas rubra TaxID=1035890 RepID=A0ABW5ZZ72_9BACT